VELHVAFLPEERGAMTDRVAVVIDVLRAATSVLTVLERGCAEVAIAPSLEAARRYRTARPGMLTAGEEGGQAPEGFDFGNSPVAFARSDLAGRRLVLATTNGTRAVHAVREAPLVLLGCLRNRTAVARAAVDGARRDLGITLVCAGREGRFSLDDAYTAGAIADVIAAEAAPHTCVCTDAVAAARALYHASADAETLFRSTAAGRNLLRIGLEEDVRYCAAADCAEVVPRVGERVVLLDA